jgi:hypothetical protein
MHNRFAREVPPSLGAPQECAQLASESRPHRGSEVDVLALSPRLMLQAVMTISLVENLLQTASIFYVQRRPEELADRMAPPLEGSP